MFQHTFLEVLKHDGVVSITTWCENNVHVSNTWNQYLEVCDENKVLIPAAWLNKTERNIKENNQIILTVGSSEVPGKIGMGTGFVLEGTAKFLSSGDVYDKMKEKYSFLTRVLEITVSSIKQTI